MWEHTRESGDILEVTRPVAPGEHLVTVGEDVREGERVLAAGRVLRPADIGLLAGIGVTHVEVARRPRVAIISTGDELVGPEETPGPGRVRNVNQYSLGAWVRQIGCEPLLLGRVPDDAEAILARVREGAGSADLVLISGGSSAGARDLTRAVVESLGEPGLLFHGIAVRPGKPTVVGAHRGVPVFGLPGHPISAMVIFLVLVRPLLERLLGIPPGGTGLKVLARLADNLPSQAGREDYYQVSLRLAPGGTEAVPVFRKSGLVSAMVRGRGMVRVPAEREGLEAGEVVEVDLLS
jgi:molybdopterin molybdotransferase